MNYQAIVAGDDLPINTLHYSICTTVFEVPKAFVKEELTMPLLQAPRLVTRERPML